MTISAKFWKAAAVVTRLTRHENAAAPSASGSLGDSRRVSAAESTPPCSQTSKPDNPDIASAKSLRLQDAPSTMESAVIPSDEVQDQKDGTERDVHIYRGSMDAEPSQYIHKRESPVIGQSNHSVVSDALAHNSTTQARARPPTVLLQKYNEAGPSAAASGFENATKQPTPPVSRNGFKEKHLRVLRSLVKLNELRNGLKNQYQDIADKEAHIIPELTSISSDPTSTRLHSLIRRLQVLQEARQKLKADEEEFELAEKQLIADEWVLATLSIDSIPSLGGAPSLSVSSSPDFPPGMLDFTDDEIRVMASNQSEASSNEDDLPEKQEYERCLAEVNQLRVMMLDIKAQNEQLTFEATERRRLGRTLDRRSLGVLDRFNEEFVRLSTRLDQAEANLEHADTVLSRRRMALQRETDRFVAGNSVVLQDVISIPRSQSPSFPDDEQYYELKNSSPKNFEDTTEAIASLARTLYRQDEDRSAIFKVPSLDVNGETTNMARFINQWILDRVRHSQEEAIRLATALAAKISPEQAQGLGADELTYWIGDGTEQKFIVMVKAGKYSYHESLAPNYGVSELLNDRAESHRLIGGPTSSQILVRRPSRRSTKGI